jgi:hypothetical protein
MANVRTDRMSIGATADVHDVGYSTGGVAYCKREDHHQWKYGDEHWAARSKRGFITFGDRHLGGAVQHRVRVLPGEDYTSFWSRIKRAEERGYIDTMGVSAYSAKDQAILEKEMPELKVSLLTVDPSAYKGLTPVEAKAWLATNKQDTKEEGIISNRQKWPLGAVLLLCLVAFWYLIYGGKRGG